MIKEKLLEPKEIINTLILILFISSFGQVASDLYLPSLPGIAQDLQVNVHWSQFTITLYMFGYSISQLIYGPLSDGLGRRVLILVGMLLGLIGSILCTISPDIWWLYAGRLLQGLGLGAGMALSRPMLRDLFSKETLAVYNSYLAIVSVVILSVGPILGGYIEYYIGWRFNFLFLSLYAFVLIIVFYLKVPETNPHLHPDHLKPAVILNNTITLISSFVFLRFTAAVFMTYAGILAWLTAAPIVLQEQAGLSPVEFGWLYVFSGLGFAVGGIINAWLVARLKIERMIFLGFFIQLIAGLFMIVTYWAGYFNVWVIIIPVTIYMVGSALIFPNASAGALSPFPKIAGTAGSIFGFLQILGGALSSALISLNKEENQLPMGIALLITAILAMWIFIITKNHNDV